MLLMSSLRLAHQQATFRHQKEFQGGECRRASSDRHVNEHKWI